MTYSGEIHLKTKGYSDIIDITDQVNKIVKNSNIKTGIVNIFCPGSTGGLTTIEYEPGLIKDIKVFLDKYLPYNYDYAHHQTWHDDNGASHLRSAFIKTSFTAPVRNNKVVLGTWQQIIFIDFDTRPRTRKLIVTVLGD